ncbi:hypothetical protein Tco_1058194 [Tanacetum coccineum]|uniref:Tf2-1-like SH3-like domain-containing protein n=1 Tax=Tanacetum coccineum TaxID=301880 RepID=A0ABQ5H7I7_9ASTR
MDMLRACYGFGNGWDKTPTMRIQAARDKQKSYADRRRKPLEFEVRDKVMIIAKVGTLAYRLELPEQLSRVHSTFHVSNLKKCFVDEPLAIPLDEIQIDEKLHFIEEPVEIMDREVMAAPVIYISFDTSEETDPIVTPEVGTVSVVSPAGVLDLVDYSPSSDSDPLEDSLPPAPYLPLVSPFLCSDDSKADEFSLAPVVAPPGIRRLPAILVQPDEAIPFGRLYRTHLNRPRKLLTVRKRVRHIPAHRLAMEDVISHSSEIRFVHRSLARTPRHSEAFRRWSSAPLSTPYPLTTSESSLGSSSKRSLDSSSPSSRPSHKRCRSPTTLVPSSNHVSRSIAPTPTDLLPPRKRFRDSYSSEDNGEEHMEVDTTDAEAVADVGISKGVVAHPEDGVSMGFEIASSDVREDDEEFEVRIDRITKIETTQRQLETSQMVASGEQASLVERIRSLRLEYLKEEFCQVRRDRDDTRRRLRRLESYVERHLGFRP